ncbi:hypothetical protein DL96DRAFT_1597040 [Flagelloscypha sp. PMI_526]|nr:hypothetical protein DL96DRAFT_1597040 [Flagelloscypha sp. PMI_526]
MGDDVIHPPTTSHVLRPHHVVLVKMLSTLWKYLAAPPKEQMFIDHRFLLPFTVQPRPYKQLIAEIRSMPTTETIETAAFYYNFLDMAKMIKDTDTLSHVFTGTTNNHFLFAGFPCILLLPTLNHIQARRSLFGLFTRRCCLSHLKLSFTGLSKLLSAFQAWCADDQQAGLDLVRRDQLTGMDPFILRTKNDKTEWARPDAYADYERGIATGDHKLTVESVRHFFEQRFNDGTDSGLRQHALLSVLLDEAIGVARAKGDRVSLQLCLSVYPEGLTTSRPPINEIQPDIHPMEEQPLSAGFQKLVEGLAVFDLCSEGRASLIAEKDYWAHHAIQSNLWSLTGCMQLASVEEDIIMLFTDAGTDDNNRVQCAMNRAYALARNGEYEAGLSLLLTPETWSGLILSDYQDWAHYVWRILVLRATRRGQDRVYTEQLLPRRAPHKLHDPLLQILATRMSMPGSPTSLEPLLRALWWSEFMGRMELYRTSILLLADMGLEFGMTIRSKNMIADVMPQIMNGDNIELRAFGCLMYARCCIVKKVLNESLPYLLKSEEDYLRLGMYRQAQDATYYRAVVYNSLGRIAERDQASKRHAELRRKQRDVEEVSFDSEVQEILDIVAAVGGAITARR